MTNTNFSIDNISDHIVVERSSRCFFNDYPYKIVFNTKNTKLFILDKLELLVPKDADVKSRSEHFSLSLFLKDRQCVLNILENSELSQYITRAVLPFTQEEEQLILDKKHIRLRKSLFLKKYKFKLYLKNGDISKLMDIYTWLVEMKEQGNDLDLNLNLKQLPFNVETKKRWYYYFGVYAVCFNDETLWLLAKLKFDEHIIKIEEAVLN